MSPPLTLAALLDRQARLRPDAVALLEGEERITYARLDVLSRRAAAWLRAHGVGPGDRVAIWLVNRAEWLVLLLALTRVGATAVAVNTRFRAVELEHVLQRSRARMLVVQPRFRKIDFLAVLRDVRPPSLSALEHVAIVGAQDDAASEMAGRRAVSLDLAGVEPAAADAADPDSLAILFTTSGTTGGPKLVMHRQRTIALHSTRLAERYGLDEAGGTLLAALPFCGVFGLNPALGALAGGSRIVIMDAFDGPAAAALVRAHGVTHAFGGDEMFRRILDAGQGPRPFPSARIFGFATFHPGVAELADEAWRRGVPLHGLYGSSEVNALFALQPSALPLEQRIEGGGRPTSCDAEMRVRDVETGELLPAGRSGELEFRAPTSFMGYLDDAAATSRAILPDGFFRTGDVGRLRDDGTFVYETRRDDALRLSGFLVNPGEIEDVLKHDPAVADAQVVGVEIGGQARCVAFVVPAGGAAPREADVIASARQAMAAFKVPARVWFVDAFPTTESANGAKIQRRRLREMALERLRSTT